MNCSNNNCGALSDTLGKILALINASKITIRIANIIMYLTILSPT